MTDLGVGQSDCRDCEPFWVEMNLHMPGKGYSLSVHTAHVEMQVYVSEAGRVVRAYEPRKKARTWVCVGCGATTGRYDNGEACETCVMTSFAEGG